MTETAAVAEARVDTEAAAKTVESEARAVREAALECTSPDTGRLPSWSCKDCCPRYSKLRREGFAR